MARMDFGDLEFDFDCEIDSNKYDQIKDKLFGLYQELCSKYQEISDYGILYEWILFDSDKKSIDIIVPENWQQHELFVLFFKIGKKYFSVVPGYVVHSKMII